MNTEQVDTAPVNPVKHVVLHGGRRVSKLVHTDQQGALTEAAQYVKKLQESNNGAAAAAVTVSNLLLG